MGKKVDIMAADERITDDAVQLAQEVGYSTESDYIAPEDAIEPELNPENDVSLEEAYNGCDDNTCDDGFDDADDDVDFYEDA